MNDITLCEGPLAQTVHATPIHSQFLMIQTNYWKQQLVNIIFLLVLSMGLFQIQPLNEPECHSDCAVSKDGRREVFVT